MWKKALKKLSKITSRRRIKPPASPKAQQSHGPKHNKAQPPSARLLSAEGWKRLMMRKYKG